jgi:DNA-binding transcriptional LysR family regulator
MAGLSMLSAVIDSRNFARAAEVLALSSPGLDRYIARFGIEVGIRLLDRTTRSMTLIEDGASVLNKLVKR